METSILFPISVRISNYSNYTKTFQPYKENFDQQISKNSQLQLEMTKTNEALYYLQIKKKGLNVSLCSVNDQMATFSSTPYNPEAMKINKDGSITLLKADNEEYSGSIATYFGSENKNTLWDGHGSCSITLDLSNYSINDITCWCLSFNQKLQDGSYGYVDELKFGIAKTNTGFKIADLTGDVGVYWSQKDLENILKLGKEFYNNNPKITIFATYDKPSLNYEINVDDISIKSTKKMSAPVVGYRSMWHVVTNNNKTIITDITLEK